MIWHYAVWKRRPYMWPACMTVGDVINTMYRHGITIVRGDVNCEDCLRMMGPT